MRVSRAKIALDHELGVKKCSNERVPVQRGVIGNYAVEIVRVRLRQLVPLPATRRAAFPIGEFRRLSVECLGQRLRLHCLLVDCADCEVFPEIAGERAVGIECEVAARLCGPQHDLVTMAGIRRRRNSPLTVGDEIGVRRADSFW